MVVSTKVAGETISPLVKLKGCFLKLVKLLQLVKWWNGGMKIHTIYRSAKK